MMNKSILISIIGILLTSMAQSQERRLALIIGNSNYGSNRSLNNPLNDAEDMASTLRQLGFELMPILKDASLRQMEEAVSGFTTKLNNYDVGIFYYAGHGMELEGKNYLVPIGVKPNMSEGEVKWECYASDRLRDMMQSCQGKNKNNIVILDACRDNPYRSWRGSSDRAWASSSTNTPKVFTCYSSSQGQKAADGSSRNSPFVGALKKWISEPNLEVSVLFGKVQKELYGNNKQMLEYDDQMLEEFYFTKRTTPTPTTPTGLIDSDGDGITDGVDKCPYEKGELRNEGCPSAKLNPASNYTERNKGINMDMVYVEGGSYTMGCTAEQGSECDDNEKPSHKETVGSFYISKTEVTQAQWALIMGGDRPSYFKNCDRCPVENVSWYDAQGHS
jgi:hypothetical protein